MEDEEKLRVELLKTLDAAINEGQWEGSLFFQAAGKKLRDLRDSIKKELNVDIENQPITKAVVEQAKQFSGLIDVYVSLYSAEGNNINKWEIILSNISRQAISRPIYKKEKDIREMISAKENSTTDAYIIAYVSENTITKSLTGKPLLDRYGHELLVLKENAIRTENIAKFIHKSGEYGYEKGRLVRLATTV